MPTVTLTYMSYMLSALPPAILTYMPDLVSALPNATLTCINLMIRCLLIAVILIYQTGGKMAVFYLLLP